MDVRTLVGLSAAMWMVGGAAGCGKAARGVWDGGPPDAAPEEDAAEPEPEPPPPEPKPIEEPEPEPPDAGPDLDGFVPLEAFCEGKGPVIRLPIGSSTDEVCVTELARNTFKSALCTCGSATLGGALHTSSFSFLSPDDIDSGGASIGINGDLLAAGYVDVGGSLRLGGQGQLPLDTAAGYVNVWGDLEVHQHFELFGALTVAGDAYFGGGASYLPSWAGAIAGDALVQEGTTELSPLVVVGGERRTETFTLDTPCDCDPSDQLDVDALVDDAVVHNDNPNPDVMLDAAALSGLSGDMTITLPCGRFYLDEITGDGDVELVVDGRTALFVEGDVAMLGGFTITLGAEGELDLFISGNLTQVGVGTFGDQARPSGVRVYVGGNGDIQYAGLQPFSANLYAPGSALVSTGLIDVRGALFVESVTTGGGLNIHYDREILKPGDDDGCHDDYVPECSDACDPICTGQTCIGGLCGACVDDSDCCGGGTCNPDGSCEKVIL